MVANKEATAAFRVTRTRKALYREMAAVEGLRLSEWLRRLADERVAEIAEREVRRPAVNGRSG